MAEPLTWDRTCKQLLAAACTVERAARALAAAQDGTDALTAATTAARAHVQAVSTSMARARPARKRGTSAASSGGAGSRAPRGRGGQSKQARRGRSATSTPVGTPPSEYTKHVAALFRAAHDIARALQAEQVRPALLRTAARTELARMEVAWSIVAAATGPAAADRARGALWNIQQAAAAIGDIAAAAALAVGATPSPPTTWDAYAHIAARAAEVDAVAASRVLPPVTRHSDDGSDDGNDLTEDAITPPVVPDTAAAPVPSTTTAREPLAALAYGPQYAAPSQRPHDLCVRALAAAPQALWQLMHELRRRSAPRGLPRTTDVEAQFACGTVPSTAVRTPPRLVHVVYSLPWHGGVVHVSIRGLTRSPLHVGVVTQDGAAWRTAMPAETAVRGHAATAEVVAALPLARFIAQCEVLRLQLPCECPASNAAVFAYVNGDRWMPCACLGGLLSAAARHGVHCAACPLTGAPRGLLRQFWAWAPRSEDDDGDNGSNKYQIATTADLLAGLPTACGLPHAPALVASAVRCGDTEPPAAAEEEASTSGGAGDTSAVSAATSGIPPTAATLHFLQTADAVPLAWTCAHCAQWVWSLGAPRKADV